MMNQILEVQVFEVQCNTRFSYSSILKNVMYLGVGILIIVNLLSSTYQIVLLKESVSFMNDYESACLLVQWPYVIQFLEEQKHVMALISKEMCSY